MPCPPTIAFEGGVLRPFREEDASSWYAYLQDCRVTEHTSWPPISRELVETLVDQVMAGYADRSSLRWAICAAGRDDLIGSCGFLRFASEREAAELAYDLAPAHWGGGLMGSAVGAAVSWARQSGFIRRVEAFVMTTNARSIGVLERAGFSRECALPAFREARGEPRDFYRYAISWP